MDKNVSKLSHHKLHKKKGLIATPFNDGLRDQLSFSSWTQERMPDYLWLGLILMYYGRNEGLKRVAKIFSKITEDVKKIDFPRLSIILSANEEDKRSIFKIISENIDKHILSPLTVIYLPSDYPIFNEYFNVLQISVETRINQLSEAIKLYYFHQSHEATDLRFLAIYYQSLLRKMHFAKSTKESAEALEKYPNIEHSDENMRRYRPMIRCMEIVTFGDVNNTFNNHFWRKIGMMTSCNPVVIKFDENKDNYDNYFHCYRKIIKYLFSANKGKSFSDDKFSVIIGLINYALKIFYEINQNKLGNSILGRHGIRTIIEIFIMLKYLIKHEKERPNIWEEFKMYGIGKYKLVLLKAREKNIDESTHFIPPIVDVLVNEIKWEEFIDVDLKYFDDQNIRKKSEDVGEKELYDICYDYDSSFAHGLWGAIRESSMLHCDNPTHQYHSVPDTENNQRLPDVKSDCLKIMNKIFLFLTQIYEVPKNLKDELGVE